MIVNKYLGKQYDKKNYNCLHFTAEVWKDLTGVCIMKRLEEWSAQSVSNKKVSRDAVRSAKFLKQMENPCLVLFQRRKGSPHLGVGIDGKVLHITETGPMWIDLEIAKLGFSSIRFMK